MQLLELGASCPDVTVLDHNGNEVSLSSYKGKKLIVYFFPRASTPGCTAQSCNLSDNYERFQKEGYEILGVSADTVEKQKKFQEKYNFPFLLLADTERKLIDAFGVWGPKKFMGKSYEGIHRITFVFDEKHILIDIVSKVKTKDHSNQLFSLNEV